MPGNPREMITTAERRFPVRIRMGVPPADFGQRYTQMTAWLDENCGAGGWAMTPSGTRGVLNDEEDGTIMALIDRHYLARPYYGSRRMAAWLATQGHLVNRKRVQRLMRLMGLVAIYQRPNTKYGKAARRPSCRWPPLTALLGSG
jgi:hypothetical protein